MPEIGNPYRFTASNLRTLIHQGSWKRWPWRPQRSHPGDALLYHYQLVDSSTAGTQLRRPEPKKQMILQFGDGKDSANFLSAPYPIMVKTRLTQAVYQERYHDSQYTHQRPPILGMYEIHRHYHDHFYETDDMWNVLPWNSKRSTLIWRGSSSGQRRTVVEQYIDYPQDDIDVAFSQVLKIHQGKLSQPDAHYLKQPKSIPQLLSYKYLLVLEGWGMASGLKWMLYSNSVVFMAPPTKTSWAMEEKLVPYVHYIPLWQNHSNLPQQLAWARDHDDECYQMVLHSRHYMERLVTSKQAQEETLEILKEMDRIYQENYRALLQSCDA